MAVDFCESKERLKVVSNLRRYFLEKRLQALGYRRQNSSETLIVSCTQTDDTRGEIPEYLPVHKNDDGLEDVDLLEYPELNMFKDMFTPRSRIGGSLSNHQIALDEPGIEALR